MTITAQFSRRARIQVKAAAETPGVDVNPDPARPQLSMQFDVSSQIGGGAEPPTARIDVWNLNKTARDRMSGLVARTVDFSREVVFVGEGLDQALKRGTDFGGSSEIVTTANGQGYLRLFAGYQTTGLGEIFEGAMQEPLNHTHSGNEWRTTINAVGMGTQLQQGWGGKTWTSDVNVSDVVTYLASDVLLSDIRTPLPTLVQNTTLTSGFTADAPAGDILDELARLFTFDWWVHAGGVYFAEGGRPIPGPTLVISGADRTGAARVLDRPAKIEGGFVSAPIQLDARAIPGRRVELVSSEVAGIYRIERVRSVGHNTGRGPWRSDLTLRPDGQVDFLS